MKSMIQGMASCNESMAQMNQGRKNEPMTPPKFNNNNGGDKFNNIYGDLLFTS